MNPICKTDIDSPECQTWMNEVCAHCRDMFAKEATNNWAAWWRDETPVFFKDVSEMTVYDCQKLKHLLELEVAALHPTELITYASKSFNFMLWQKILLILLYIAIIVIIVVICRYWSQREADHDSPVDEEKDETVQTKSPQSSQPLDDLPVSQKKKFKMRIWMRDRIRPIFLHNDVALRRQQAKYRERELLREAYTQQNIEKWTKAREKIEKKRMERKSKAYRKSHELDQDRELDDTDD